METPEIEYRGTYVLRDTSNYLNLAEMKHVSFKLLNVNLLIFWIIQIKMLTFVCRDGPEQDAKRVLVTVTDLATGDERDFIINIS